MGNAIKLVPDEGLYKSGIVRYLMWDYSKYPHMVLFGSSGTGKTYLLKIILGRICTYIQEAELIVCDYKGDDDFSFLDGFNNFYRFDRCLNGLECAVQCLKERQQKDNSDKHFLCLVFDEWASFINSLDKKAADNAKQQLAVLLMLGRSFNIHVIISQQRLDASYFASSRDNFSAVIGMGALSKEAVEMMFSEYKDIIVRNKTQGHGSAILGNRFREIIVPTVRDVNKLHAAIASGVNRP